jgi:hypothetical protein
VSTFQPSRSTQTREAATTQVKLERAHIDVDAGSGQVFVNWTNDASEFKDGRLGDKSCSLGRQSMYWSRVRCNRGAERGRTERGGIRIWDSG